MNALCGTEVERSLATFLRFFVPENAMGENGGKLSYSLFGGHFIGVDGVVHFQAHAIS
jgi:hypothetical protein